MSEAKPGSFTAAFTQAICKAGEDNPKLVAITAAMPDSTGLLPFGERFPDRLIDVGIAEQHAVTAAAGMAMGGLRPVVALYSTFLTRAIDQVMYDVGLHHQPVTFVLDRAGITGNDGASHHGVLDMVLLTKVPGMTVLAPSSYQEVGQMLADALLLDGPVAIRFAGKSTHSVGDDEVGMGLAGRRARTGSDVCLLAVGKMVEVALGAADELAASGVSATVWDARCVKPLDPEMIADAASHPAVVTIEDGFADGGAGAAMAAAISAHAVTASQVPPPVSVLGVPSIYIPHGKVDTILAGLGLDVDGLVAAARQVLAARSS
jgi:1-deoxy-D-xylulose-5-phosphate synthase